MDGGMDDRRGVITLAHPEPSASEGGAGRGGGGSYS